MNPLFIIGTERSGTNLIRLILNSHRNIAIPHPPHILKNFFKVESLYSDLKKDTNFKRLIKDVVRMVELHHYPWEITIDKNRIFNSINERDLINVFFAIYDQYLESTNKKRWGCKSTFMIQHVVLIRCYYPQAKFIYMVRDGRDVAVSAKKTIFNHYSVYYTAKLWKQEQQIGIYWLSKLCKNDIFLIRYEDLLNDPEGSVKSLCHFLAEPYEKDMLRSFKTREAKKSAGISAAWRNTSNPIMKNNVGKFRTELSEREIDLFEAMAGQELDYFSYELAKPLYVTERVRTRRVKFRIAYLLEEIVIMLKVQIKYLLSDKNNLLRYEKFWFLKLIRIKRMIKWN